MIDHLAPERRAKQLLIEHLDDEQLKMFEVYGSFEVQTPAGRFGKRNRWRIGPMGGVRMVEGPAHRTPTGRLVGAGTSLCVNVRGPIPFYDSMLGLKLMLETREGMETLLATRGMGVG